MKRQMIKAIFWTSMLLGLASINAQASGGPMPDPSGGTAVKSVK